MESGPQGRPHLAKISSKEMKFPSGASVLCPAGSEVPCLPEPPSWGRLGSCPSCVSQTGGIPGARTSVAPSGSGPDRPAWRCGFSPKGLPGKGTLCSALPLSSVLRPLSQAAGLCQACILGPEQSQTGNLPHLSGVEHRELWARSAGGGRSELSAAAQSAGSRPLACSEGRARIRPPSTFSLHLRALPRGV